MKKREYKQMASILLEQVKLLKRRERDARRMSLSSNMKEIVAKRLVDTKNRELVILAARNADLAAKVKALEARDAEVSALRKEYAESYSKGGMD